jgi:Tfp pilus assembly protein FimT
LRSRQRGIAFIDLVLVVAIVAILGAYAAMKMRSAGENTIYYQAQKFARDLRHMQVLAATYGRSLQLTATPGTNGSYTVSCVTSTGSSPCNISPIIDPVTGSGFTGSFQDDVSLSVTTGLNPAVFDPKGRPLSGSNIYNATTNYTLTYGSTSVVVSISPVTGFVNVSP